jgi:hypothetical protein
MFLQINSRIGIGQVKVYKWIQGIREIWVLVRDSFVFRARNRVLDISRISLADLT